MSDTDNQMPEYNFSDINCKFSDEQKALIDKAEWYRKTDTKINNKLFIECRDVVVNTPQGMSNYASYIIDNCIEKSHKLYKWFKGAYEFELRDGVCLRLFNEKEEPEYKITIKGKVYFDTERFSQVARAECKEYENVTYY